MAHRNDWATGLFATSPRGARLTPVGFPLPSLAEEITQTSISYSILKCTFKIQSQINQSMKKIIFLSMLITFSINLHAQEIGLQLYSLRDQFPKDVPGTMALVKSWGIKEVELAGTYGLPTEDFKKMLAQNNLIVIGTGAEFEKLASDPQTVANEAKLLGAKYVVCFWIPHVENDFTLEEAEKAVSVFNAAGKVIKENGLSLCYHAHGFEFRPYQKETLFDYLVKSLDANYVNFEMDVFWINHAGQSPVALLKEYPNRFLLMHLKDRKPGTLGNLNGRADVETNVVLGRGDVGIAAIMKVAKKAGVKHFFIEDESLRSQQQIPLSLDFLRGLKH
ncbi:MAG: sugar phosphate isomerase/epimerase family protein [Cyclobacteriaceae bacterium]